MLDHRTVSEIENQRAKDPTLMDAMTQIVACCPGPTAEEIKKAFRGLGSDSYICSDTLRRLRDLKTF